MDWLQDIPYFQKKKRREVASLPIAEIARFYPSIKAEYDRLTKGSKRPRPNWVYSAFMRYSEAPKKPELEPAPEINQLELFGGIPDQEQSRKPKTSTTW